MSDRSTETAVTGVRPAAPEGDLAPGTEVESFRIECTLGRGGMSTVYGAVHTVIGKRGAIKVLRRELCTDQLEVGRFVQEARAVNQIGHANIVDVFAFGVLPDGRSYLIMEWLVGQSLRNRLRRGPLTRNEVREIVLDIVRALEATHAKGIIHRDLKPDNVFLAETPGERPRAKLLDFGVAKLTGEGRHDRTRIGSMLGTPQYLPPEQARGEPDQRSDIYALGAMLFEMVAGRPPFIGENAMDVVSKHMMDAPPKLSSLAKDVPPELDALVDAMLAKDPADRPTLLRIRSELERMTTPKRELPKTGMQTAATRRRGKLGFVIAGLLGALAVIIAVLAIRASSGGDDLAVKQEDKQQRREERQERREERREERRAAKEERREVREPEPPPVAAEPKGTLTISWRGTEDVKFTVNGAAAVANQPIELTPGTYEVATVRKSRIEKQRVMIRAGDTKTVTIKPGTRAPSGGNDDNLNPYKDGTR